MEFLQEFGYIGLFIGTFLAATIIPFSSEFLIIGILVAGGDPAISFVCATIGNWLGGLTSYYLGYLGKWEWIEKWFRVSKASLDRQKSKIDKYGALVAFFSWAPFVGDILAIGLGFYKLNFTKCAIYMLIGKAARFAMWILLYKMYGEKFVAFISHTWS
ncbi:MAG: YqaA family protein [Bacteroidales bacterium]